MLQVPARLRHGTTSSPSVDSIIFPPTTASGLVRALLLLQRGSIRSIPCAAQSPLASALLLLLLSVDLWQVGTVCYACWADALNWTVLLAVLAVVLSIVVLIIKRSGNARSRTMGVR